MATSRKSIREWVAGKMGQLKAVTITVDGADSTLFTVPDLGDASEDNQRYRDSFLMPDDGTKPMPEWRRITSVATNMASLFVNRAYTTNPAAAQSSFIYSLLTPDEWNDAINEVMVTLYFPDRADLNLRVVTTDDPAREYDLPTWVSTRGQIRDIRYRNITTQREEPVPRYKVIESIEGLSIALMDAPWSSTTYDLILEGTRWHSRLDEDDWGTTCPQQLWQAEVEVAAYHKVMKKYGQRFKQNFAQDLAIAERERLKARADILPVMIAREYTHDDDWGGPDIDSFFVDSGWA